MGLVRVSVAYAAKQAARKLRAMEPIFVLLRSLFIGSDTIREVEPAANERRMIRVSQRVVRRSRRLDAHDLHGRRQRLLRARAVSLGVENQLRVVPGIHPRRVHAVEREIFLQNYNIVEAPRQKRRVFAAPVVKRLHCLAEGLAPLLENGILDACEARDLAVHLFIIGRTDQRLKLVGDLAVARHANRADLDNLAANGARQNLFRARRARPRLVPLHVQNDILHTLTSVRKTSPDMVSQNAPYVNKEI